MVINLKKKYTLMTNGKGNGVPGTRIVKKRKRSFIKKVKKLVNGIILMKEVKRKVLYPIKMI